MTNHATTDRAPRDWSILLLKAGIGLGAASLIAFTVMAIFSHAATYSLRKLRNSLADKITER